MNNLSIDPKTKLHEIDPTLAWQPWEPTNSEPWDHKRASLLFRRAGFCAPESTIQSALKVGPAKIVESMFSPDDEVRRACDEFESESAVLAETAKASGEPKRLTTWWLHRMLHNPRPLIEKMTLFWHGHFATGAEKVLDVELMLDQNILLRKHAVGDFRAMVHGIAKDPAMLIYLDSVTNRKAHANENFARELMELFCLGEGNYSESDVQQLARCFTGWEIRRKNFRFNAYQHDTGVKTLFGKKVATGEEAIDEVLAHKHLPFFIARKLVRFLICDEPEASDALLEPLAKRFSSDNLSLAGMLQVILGSRLMLSDWSVAKKVRSPIDLSIGFMRSLDATANLEQLSNRLREIGQSLFFPPNVKGWDGGRAWVNSSTLVGRANLIHQLVRDDKTRFSGEGIANLMQRHADGNPEKFLSWFCDLFLAVDLNDSQRTALLQSLKGKPGEQSCREMLSLLSAIPQFQLA